MKQEEYKITEHQAGITQDDIEKDIVKKAQVQTRSRNKIFGTLIFLTQYSLTSLLIFAVLMV
jgi:hypothetical protein